MKKWLLKLQLWRAGADKRSAEELSDLADAITRSSDIPQLSDEKKQEIAAKIGIDSSSSVILPKAVFAGVSALMISTVLVSQWALPGSALYGIKRSTEEVRVLVQPSYKEQLVDRREAELEYLQENEADNDAIERAQKEYEKAQKRLQKEQEDAADDRADAIEDAQKRDANGDRVDSDLRVDTDDSGSEDDNSGRGGDDSVENEGGREGRDANGDRIDSDLR